MSLRQSPLWDPSTFRLLVRPWAMSCAGTRCCGRLWSRRSGIPCQVIAASLELPLELEDLGSLPEDERQSRAVARMREEIQRPFDLARGPLVRACLLRMGEQEHIALVIMHHTISDGWSIGILIREVSVLYESFLKGESSPLPDLSIQYADYAVWQRNWLQGANPGRPARLLDETARGLA